MMPGTQVGGRGFGLYKMFVYFKAFVHERIIPFLPLTSALPTLLQY